MSTKKTNTRPVLTASCNFPEVFRCENGGTDSFMKRPKSEIVYSRSDYDGYRWWTTWWDCQEEKPAPELTAEIDRFHSSLLGMPEFESLNTMRRLCGKAEPTGDPTEFNLYAETEHFYIHLRLIDRYRDYNLYVHYYLKPTVPCLPDM